jgi:transposase
MLTMTEIDDIRDAYYKKGKGISEIAKKFGKDRKTVRKYVRKEDFNWTRKESATGKCQPKLDPYKGTIDKWLSDDLKAKRKQRHTARRVYDRLIEIEEGFSCSYRTVASYVKRKKKDIYGETDAALPLVHKAGEAQVDFGSAEFWERGTRYSGKYLNVCFPSSNAGYMQLFKGENTECFFEGLRNIFEFLGGVPPRLWFDNASVMVESIKKKGGRDLTEAFLRFKQHYGFEDAFCNPASGNEKGGVENKVGYNRRNMLVPLPDFDDLTEYNRTLLAKCVKDHEREHYRFNETIVRLHEKDKDMLLPLPSVAFDCAKYETHRVDAWGKFRLTPNHVYSTSPKHARGRLTVRITSGEVIPLDDNHRPVTVHQRLYGQHKQEAMDWIPYLTQLSRNPGALKYTGIWNMLPDPLQDYLEAAGSDERKAVLKVLARLSERDGFKSAVASVKEALSRNISDIDSLIALHDYLNGEKIPDLMDLETARLPFLPLFSFPAESYDAMLGVGGSKKC